MREEDVLLPSYRDNGALIWRGVKLEEILLFWGGDERGNDSCQQQRLKGAKVADRAQKRNDGRDDCGYR
jgi:TPP-dependent pyruvate/acetoin dehydrogenase alpha subunit